LVGRNRAGPFFFNRDSARSILSIYLRRFLLRFGWTLRLTMLVSFRGTLSFGRTGHHSFHPRQPLIARGLEFGATAEPVAITANFTQR